MPIVWQLSSTITSSMEKLNLNKEDISKLADVAEEIGAKLAELASQEHDRLQEEFDKAYPEKLSGYLADVITLNASINSLAFLVAVALASQNGEQASKYIDKAKETLHDTVANLIGKDGKGIFIKMPAS